MCKSKIFIKSQLLYRLIALFGLFVLSFNAQAFKIDTHVWVGQQIINDLQDDGQISIKKNNGTILKFTIDPRFKDAILQYPEFFRMGNIGPDAFPDIYTGQFTVHPGISPELDVNGDGWHADDWLRFLMSSRNTDLKSPKIELQSNPEYRCPTDPGSECIEPVDLGEMIGSQRAFVLGYLGHAATDTFAHSYVNLYSGDKFVVIDEIRAGLTFDDAFVEEARHIELEKYLNLYMPPLEDHLGNPLGSARGLIKAPTEFLRNRLVFNLEVSERNAAGGAGHLSSVYKLRTSLVGADEDKLHLLDTLAAKYVVSEYSGYDMSDEETESFIRRVKKWHQWVSNNNGVEEAQIAMNQFFDGLQDTITFTADLRSRLNTTLVDSFNALTNYADSASVRILAEEERAMATLVELLRPNISSCKLACRVACRPNPLCDSSDEASCNARCDDILLLHVRYRPIKNLIDTHQPIVDALNAEILRTAGLHEEVVQELEAAVQEGLNMGLDAFNAVTELFQAFTADMNITRNTRDNWVRDLELGIDAYIDASALIADELMKPDGGSPLTPLTDWQCRWIFPMTTGLYSQLTTGVCDTTDHLSKMIEALNNAVAKILSIGPGIAELQQKIDEIKLSLNSKAEDLALEFAQKILDDNVDIKKLIQAFSAKTNDVELNKVFAMDHSTGGFKGLLEFPDMAARVKAEMHLDTATQKLDPDLFLPLKNAVTLSKLALLSPQQLNTLANVPDPLDPTMIKKIYNEDPTKQVNILIGAIRNLDGNQQWMSIAPPYPRRVGFADPVWADVSPTGRATQRKYGYGSEDTTVTGETKGFFFWSVCEARPVFRQLFTGPMPESLVIPDTLSADIKFAPKLNAAYTDIYPVTGTNPFPDDNWNTDLCLTTTDPVDPPVEPPVGDADHDDADHDDDDHDEDDHHEDDHHDADADDHHDVDTDEGHV